MRNKFLPIASLLAVLLLFGLITACGGTSDDDSSSLGFLNGASDEAQNYEAQGGADGDAPRDVAGTTGDNADSILSPGEAPAPAGVGGGPASGSSNNTLAQPALLDRQIIRTATIELTVEDVPAAIQLIETAASAAGGFVSGSNLSVETDTPPPDDEDAETEVRQRGTITIRVPAESYLNVMNGIRGLVDDPTDIKALSEDASEVTEEYADLQSRLRNLEATEQQYLELLGRAETINDILLVQDRLNTTRLEIEQVQGRVQLLDDLTAMATITVQLALPPLIVEPLKPEANQSWAAEAWENAWEASQDVAEALGVAAITGGVVLAWLLIPGALVLGGWWILGGRRARNEAT